MILELNDGRLPGNHLPFFASTLDEDELNLDYNSRIPIVVHQDWLDHLKNNSLRIDLYARVLGKLNLLGFLDVPLAPLAFRADGINGFFPLHKNDVIIGAVRVSLRLQNEEEPYMDEDVIASEWTQQPCKPNLGHQQTASRAQSSAEVDVLEVSDVSDTESLTLSEAILSINTATQDIQRRLDKLTNPRFQEDDDVLKMRGSNGEQNSSDAYRETDLENANPNDLLDVDSSSVLSPTSVERSHVFSTETTVNAPQPNELLSDVQVEEALSTLTLPSSMTLPSLEVEVDELDHDGQGRLATDRFPLSMMSLSTVVLAEPEQSLYEYCENNDKEDESKTVCECATPLVGSVGKSGASDSSMPFLSELSLASFGSVEMGLSPLSPDCDQSASLQPSPHEISYGKTMTFSDSEVLSSTSDSGQEMTNLSMKLSVSDSNVSCIAEAENCTANSVCSSPSHRRGTSCDLTSLGSSQNEIDMALLENRRDECHEAALPSQKISNETPIDQGSMRCDSHESVIAEPEEIKNGSEGKSASPHDSLASWVNDSPMLPEEVDVSGLNDSGISIQGEADSDEDHSKLQYYPFVEKYDYSMGDNDQEYLEPVAVERGDEDEQPALMICEQVDLESPENHEPKHSELVEEVLDAECQIDGVSVVGEGKHVDACDNGEAVHGEEKAESRERECLGQAAETTIKSEAESEQHTETVESTGNPRDPETLLGSISSTTVNIYIGGTADPSTYHSSTSKPTLSHVETQCGDGDLDHSSKLPSTNHVELNSGAGEHRGINHKEEMIADKNLHVNDHMRNPFSHSKDAATQCSLNVHCSEGCLTQRRATRKSQRESLINLIGPSQMSTEFVQPSTIESSSQPSPKSCDFPTMKPRKSASVEALRSSLVSSLKKFDMAYSLLHEVRGSFEGSHTPRLASARAIQSSSSNQRPLTTPNKAVEIPYCVRAPRQHGGFQISSETERIARIMQGKLSEWRSSRNDWKERDGNSSDEDDDYVF